MKNSKDKLYTFTLIACIIVLLVAFILTLVNVLDLRITSDREFPAWIEFVGNSLLFMISYLLCCKKSIEQKNWFFCFILFIPVFYFSTYFLGVTLVTSGIIPIVFLLIYLKIKKLFKLKNIINCIGFNLSMLIYQPISIYVKIGIFNISYNKSSFIETLLFSLDLIVFLILIERRVDFYEFFKLVGHPREHVVFTKTKSVQRVQKTSETHLSTEGLTRKQAVVFMALAFGFQLFQLGVVLAIGQINNMLLETIAILGVFWAARETVGKCYHADTLLKCSAITFISFYVLTKVTPPLEISLFSVVCITAIYVYILHAVEMKREHIEYLESVISPENTMRKQCSDLGMSYLLTEICIDWKINGLSRQEQADKHGYSLSTIRKYRNDINKKLK